MRRVALFLALVACGGGDASEHVTLDFGPDAFTTAYREAYCQYLARCGLYRDASSCVASGLGVLGDDPLIFKPAPNVEEAAEAGKVFWDSDAAHACVTEIAAESCDLTAAPPSVCVHLSSGTVAADGRCELDEECRSGVCGLSMQDGDCAVGTCTGNAPPTAAGAGDACGDGVTCDVGLYCAQGAPGHGPFFCHQLGAVGSDCSLFGQESCQNGLACVATACVENAAEHGSACDQSSGCLEIGDWCNATCTSVGLEGDACGADAPCSPYLACGSSQHCTDVDAVPQTDPPPVCI